MQEGTHHHGPLAGFSPLAGVTAGTAAVLFAFGVLLLAWHRVAGNVSMGIEVLVYVVIAVVAAGALLALWLAFLWVRHRARNPHLLARQAVPPQYGGTIAGPAWTAAEIPAEEVLAIEAPCPYTSCHHNHPELRDRGQPAVTFTQLPPDDQD